MDAKWDLVPTDTTRFDHLACNRPLIVRRTLLSSALGGLIPIPLMDEYVSGRVRAGLLMRLAESRQVDLSASSAEILSVPPGVTAPGRTSMAATTLLAAKRAWRKAVALVALGRAADEMATTFQVATLFDHYCARMHVGAGLDRKRTDALRAAICTTVVATEKARLADAFRAGGQMLGQSLLEAPQWLSERLTRMGQRWVATRGNPDAVFEPFVDAGDPETQKWLDRAAHSIDERLGELGLDHMDALVDTFEARLRSR